MSRARALFARWGPRALGITYFAFGILLMVRNGAPLELTALGDDWGITLAAIVVGWWGLGTALVIGSGVAVLVSLLVPLAVVIVSAGQAPAAPPMLALVGIVPFQVAGHVVFDSALVIGRPFAPWHWAAYVAHLLFLVPASSSIVAGLRMRWEAARRARVRRRTLTIPVGVAELYPRNAYRVLGLDPAAASTRAVLRRRDEIKTLIDVGMPIAENVPGYSGVELGVPTSLDAGEVARAVAKLQDEPERYREALLWFRLAGEDETVLSALRSGDFDAAEQAWASRNGDRQTPARYNLAVLTHARVILSEQASAPPNPATNADAWKNAFVRWKRVLDDPKSWNETSRLISASTHPLVTKDYLRTLQKELPARILRVNLDLARAGLQGGFKEYARAHVRYVTESGLPEPAVTAALDEFFAGEIAAARHILKPLLLQSKALAAGTDFKRMTTEYRAIRERLATFAAESRLTNLAEEAVTLGRQWLVSETDVTYKRFIEADSEYFNGNSALVDEWNKHMRMHNLGIPMFEELRRVARQLRARRDGQAAVSERLAEFEGSVRRELVGLEFLRVVAADASATARESIEKTIKAENEAVGRAREEWRKTREHFDRNANGMATQVSV